jgi:hypothetical protein
MTLPMLNVAATLAIASAPPVLLASNEQLPGLRFDWTVEKTATPDPDTATITVFNLGVVSRKALEAALALPIPLVVTLSVGWGLVPEVLFVGQVWKAQPEVKTGQDILSILEVGDGALPTRDTPPAGGAWVGQVAAIATTAIATSMGLIPSPSALAAISEAGAALPVAAWQATGDGEPRQQLDDLMATLGLSWGVQDGQFVVYRAGLRNDLPPSILTPISGLLHAEIVDDGVVQFDALAQPRIVPGVQVQIMRPGPGGNLTTMIPVGSGPLRVDSVIFSGSTQGPSMMTGTARKVALL